MKKFFLDEYLRLKVVLPIAERIKGTNINLWLSRIERMQSWSEQDVVSWQNERLQAFVRHAYEHTRYYHRIFTELGLTPDDIKCASDLRKLPVIDKVTANKYKEDIIPDNLDDFRYRNDSTGGTTGIPLNSYCDEDVWGYVTAAKIFYWKQAGYHYGDRFLALGSSSLFGKRRSLAKRIYDAIRNEIPFNSMNMSEDICGKCVDLIVKKKIHFIYGYSASIYMLAKYVREKGIDLGRIYAVFCTSENLPDNYRQLIGETFGCKVMDCYGARDAGVTAYEVRRGQYNVGYNAILETIDNLEDNSGTLISTNFLNYSFPLIRYQFGDVAELAEYHGTDDYNGQVIKRIMGRTSDVMRLSNGHNLSSTGFSMIMRAFDVKAFRVRKVGDASVELCIQPIPGKYDDEEEMRIRRTMLEYLGEDCVLNIIHVEEFKPLGNGKHNYYMI